MWNPISDSAMPRFWPHRPSRFWDVTLGPLRRYYLHRYYRIAEISLEGTERLTGLDPADGVLIAPNHSHDSDPHVMMEVSRRVGRHFAFMAAWQIFRGHWGLDGWVLQRMGAFSVDREGCDRRAIRQAVELLSAGQCLVVFPEGEVYRLNERLTPLLEGVPFMALTAQRGLAKANSPARVWILPAAIRYRYVDDIVPALRAAMDGLEARILWTPHSATPLPERIIRYGEALLTIKEKEKLGRSFENEGDLPTRIARFIHALLGRLESEALKTPPPETIPLRVKALRRKFLDIWMNEEAKPEERQRAREALDDVHLAMTLYSYPGDYISEKPSVERMAETVEKFEEDIYGSARPKGRRVAKVLFGDPINLKDEDASGRKRTLTEELTARLETEIQRLMKQGS